MGCFTIGVVGWDALRLVTDRLEIPANPPDPATPKPKAPNPSLNPTPRTQARDAERGDSEMADDHGGVFSDHVEGGRPEVIPWAPGSGGFRSLHRDFGRGDARGDLVSRPLDLWVPVVLPSTG